MPGCPGREHRRIDRHTLWGHMPQAFSFAPRGKLLLGWDYLNRCEWQRDQTPSRVRGHSSDISGKRPEQEMRRIRPTCRRWASGTEARALRSFDGTNTAPGPPAPDLSPHGLGRHSTLPFWVGTCGHIPIRTSTQWTSLQRRCRPKPAAKDSAVQCASATAATPPRWSPARLSSLPPP